LRVMRLSVGIGSSAGRAVSHRLLAVAVDGAKVLLTKVKKSPARASGVVGLRGAAA
jgi:hypothetical protein